MDLKLSLHQLRRYDHQINIKRMVRIGWLGTATQVPRYVKYMLMSLFHRPINTLLHLLFLERTYRLYR
jgi:hypothetical protein